MIKYLLGLIALVAAGPALGDPVGHADETHGYGQPSHSVHKHHIRCNADSGAGTALVTKDPSWEHASTAAIREAMAGKDCNDFPSVAHVTCAACTYTPPPEDECLNGGSCPGNDDRPAPQNAITANNPYPLNTCRREEVHLRLKSPSCYHKTYCLEVAPREFNRDREVIGTTRMVVGRQHIGETATVTTDSNGFKFDDRNNPDGYCNCRGGLKVYSRETNGPFLCGPAVCNEKVENVTVGAVGNTSVEQQTTTACGGNTGKLLPGDSETAGQQEESTQALSTVLLSGPYFHYRLDNGEEPVGEGWYGFNYSAGNTNRQTNYSGIVSESTRFVVVSDYYSDGEAFTCDGVKNSTMTFAWESGHLVTFTLKRPAATKAHFGANACVMRVKENQTTGSEPDGVVNISGNVYVTF